MLMFDLLRRFPLLLALLGVSIGTPTLSAADPFNAVADEVNQKLVKIFGAGGFRGLTNYATGLIVSDEGHILSIASQTLDTPEVIVHLANGLRKTAVVLVAEPELDVALLKIKEEGKGVNDPLDNKLPFFDIAALAKQPIAEPGDWVLGFSNLFEIAMRDEPVSVQRGVIASYSKLEGRKGITEFAFTGNVYVVDAITNNPGAGGGALTDRKGRLLGIIGRELKNSLTETWMNYAIPINASVEIQSSGKTVTISIPEFVAKGMKGEYKPVERPKGITGPGGYHGIVFLPNLLDRTPAYVEEVMPDSPAAKAKLRVNDLVSFVNGDPVNSIEAFNELMKRTKPGMKVRLEVRRGDKLETVDLELTDYPKPPAPPVKK